MADVTFRLHQTGLLVVDPYNDFISGGGKLWPRIREVMEGNRCVPHMIEVLEAARPAGVRVFFAPHHRWRTGDYETWKFWAPMLGRNESHARDQRAQLCAGYSLDEGTDRVDPQNRRLRRNE